MSGYLLLASIFGFGAFLLFSTEERKEGEYHPAVMGLVVFVLVFLAAFFGFGGGESRF